MILRPPILFLLINALGLLNLSVSYPSKLQCTTKLSVNGPDRIHGSYVQSGSTYSVVIRRGVTSLASGSSYTPGETLSVSLSSSSPDYVIETTGGQFSSGLPVCSSRRLKNSGGNLIMPSDGSTVSIYSVTATSKVAVKRTTTFSLVASSSSPTPLPSSVIPSAKPTSSVIPSAKPTFPTAVPSPASSSNPLDPTALPTVYPSVKPSAAVTSPPTAGAPTVILGYTAQVVFDLAMDSSNYYSLGSNLFSGIASVLAYNLTIDASRIFVFRVGIKATQRSPFIQASAQKVDNNHNRSILQSLYKVDRDKPKWHLSSSSTYEIKTVIANLSRPTNAFDVASSAYKYITSRFVTELSSYVGKQIDSVTNVQFSTQSSEITPEYSCNLDDVLRIMWTNDERTDSIAVSLLSNTAYIWISVGVIHERSLMMVTDPPHGVFMYKPTENYAGYEYMKGYLASQITPDNQMRRFTKITSLYSDFQKSAMEFNYSSNSGISTDPKLDFSRGNYVMWAHGGVWPTIHPKGAYGVMKVDWRSGTCVSVTLTSGISLLYIYLVPLLLITLYVFRILSHKNVWKILQYKPLGNFDAFLRYIFDGEISIGDIFGALIYIVSCIVISGINYFQSVKDGGPNGRFLMRAAGDFSLMCLWMACLPCNRTGYLNFLIGTPFERRIRYHKGFVSLAMISGLVHLLLFMETKDASIYSKNSIGFKRAIPFHGLISFILFSSLCILALEPVRRRFYELFRVTHMLYIPTIAFLIFHVDGAGWGFIPGALLYVFDNCGRFTALLFASCAIESRVEDSTTVLRLKYPRYCGIGTKTSYRVIPSGSQQNCIQGYPFGQYVFLNVPRLSLIEWHPFSISEYFPEDESISVHVKSMGPGSWTNRLSEIYSQKESSGQLAVAVDGPYGKFSHDITNYKCLILVAGGIGITPMFPILSMIKNANQDVYHRMERVEVVWMVRSRSTLMLFQDKLETLFYDAKQVKPEKSSAVDKSGSGLFTNEIMHSKILFRLTIFISRDDISDGTIAVLGVSRQSYLRTNLGRPDLKSIIQGCANLYNGRSTPSKDKIDDFGSCLLVCGPAGLKNAATDAAKLSDVHYHVEVFNY